MLTMCDRLYGKIELPELAGELATTCPVLLRLREVRMANIPFFTHPSFTNVDRYEHSLGVAHLAWRWARANRLPQDLATALTIAALYHDGATPAFSHLFEEFLGRFGFDHEHELEQILRGRPHEIPGRQDAQVFLGCTCRLRSVLGRPTDVNSPLTVAGIADLAAGKGPFGRIIKGDIDVDNIDNVIRAATAMGVIRERDQIHPYAVLDAIECADGDIQIRRDRRFAIAAWENARYVLYDTILSNPYEFRAQSTLKWAIEECSSGEPRLRTRAAWKYTEPELIFKYLRKQPFPRRLVDRLRRGKPAELLFSLWLEDLSPLMGAEGEATMSRLRAAVADIVNMEVYVNYYVDRRRRRISLPVRGNRSLFSDERSARDACTVGGEGKGSSAGGVVGVVGISRAERIQAERGRLQSTVHQGAESISMKGIDSDALGRCFEDILCERPRSIWRGWMGSHPEPEQLSLTNL
jgi:hypothetical protein